jgi:hypothetical protein
VGRSNADETPVERVNDDVDLEFIPQVFLSVIAKPKLKASLVIYPHSEYSVTVRSNIGNTVIETESFIKKAAALWSPAELDDLKDYVARNPLAGDEMPGTGGLRKLRWGRAGMGKRGGARVIYYYYNETAHLYLFMAYAKAAQESPSPAAMAILTKLAEAAKAGIKAKRKEK